MNVETTTSPTECGVCNESFTCGGQHVPLLLTCGHTLCGDCARRLLNGGTVLCPWDRLSTPAARVSCLKKNHALVELIGALGTQSEKSCTECLVCKQAFTSDGERVPKLLICGHTMCERCAASVLHMNGITCPVDTCRHLTSANSVSELKKNFLFDELLTSIRTRQDTRQERPVADFSAMARAFAQSEQNIERLTGELQQKEREIASLKEKVQSEVTEKRELETTLQDTRTALETANRKVHSQQEQAERRKTYYTEEMTRLENMNKASQEQIKQIKLQQAESIATMTGVVRRYQTDAKTSQADATQKAAEIETLTQTVSTNEQTIQQLNADVTEKEQTLETVQQGNDQLQQENRRIKTVYSKKIRELEANVDSLKIGLLQLNEHWTTLLDYRFYKGFPSSQVPAVNPGQAEFNKAKYRLNRKSMESRWADISGNSKLPRTEAGFLVQFQGATIPYSEVGQGQQIGSGCHGNTHCVIWKKRTVVCVKDLNLTFDSKKKISRIDHELKTLSTLKHQNILRYFNVCMGEQQQMGIIMEYAQMSLHELLHANQTIELSETERLDLLRDVCSGLEFLHSRGLPHCNLTSTNVLIDIDKDKLCAKLTDYGLTLVREADTDTGELVRTLNVTRFSAPEVLNEKFLRGADLMMADVYSASLVIYHVAFNKEPFEAVRDHRLQMEIGKSEMIPIIPPQVQLNACVMAAMQAGWNRDPQGRPTAGVMTKTLKDANQLYAQP